MISNGHVVMYTLNFYTGPDIYMKSWVLQVHHWLTRTITKYHVTIACVHVYVCIQLLLQLFNRAPNFALLSEKDGYYLNIIMDHFHIFSQSVSLLFFTDFSIFRWSTGRVLESSNSTPVLFMLI